jgi:hypothetical protein
MNPVNHDQGSDMFHLDDRFLANAGLDALSSGEKADLLKHLYETLEHRVGCELSNGLSDAQLAEFEKIIDRDVDVIAAWVEQHSPDFLEDPVYLRMREALSSADGSTILCEYAATKWLEVNRQDYRDVVAGEVRRLKAELAAAAPGILASCIAG